MKSNLRTKNYRVMTCAVCNLYELDCLCNVWVLSGYNDLLLNVLICLILFQNLLIYGQTSYLNSLSINCVLFN